MDAAGKVAAKGRVSNDLAGLARLHDLIASAVPDGVEDEDVEVVVGIETDRGLLVRALVVAGYRVLGVNPLAVDRYRDRARVSGAKSDPGDARVLADMARTDAHQHRPVAADSELADAIKLVARAHQSAIWSRRRLAIQAALRADHPAQPAAIADAYGAIAESLTKVIEAHTRQISELDAVLTEHFGRHPDAAILRSLPGLGVVTGARVLGEFGDDPTRYQSAKARRNYAGTSPLTVASGTRRTVRARHIRNRRLADALHWWAFNAISRSPGARALYDHRRAAGDTHSGALRVVANRLVALLHGCLRTRALYNETTAWAHRSDLAA